MTINQFIKCRLVRLNFIFRLNNTGFGCLDSNSLTYDATLTSYSKNGQAADLLVAFQKRRLKKMTARKPISQKPTRIRLRKLIEKVVVSSANMENTLDEQLVI